MSEIAPTTCAGVSPLMGKKYPLTLVRMIEIRKKAFQPASGARDELQDLISRGVGVVAGAGLGRVGGPPKPVAR